MKRLTKRMKDGTAKADGCRTRELTERLAEYEDEEEHGYLCRSKVKIGDILYVPMGYKVELQIIDRIIFTEQGVAYSTLSVTNSEDRPIQINSFSESNIGTIAFLTKEEAESHLITKGE